MSFGISTSCLYPMNTEKSLETLGNLGVKTCEVFLNSPSETTSEFAKILNAIKDNFGMRIAAVHPFSSFAETYMLFSEYERRFDDTIGLYKRTFESAAMLGAKISIIHGALLASKISDERYFERFSRLYEAGKEYGITVCQENVNRHFGENPDFLNRMKAEMGNDFSLVFDVKQAVRAGFNPLEFAEEFKQNIAHIHISDHCEGFDCLPPAKGCFDFKKLISVMDSANYSGDYIIELYRENFKTPDDLKDALIYMQNL